MTVYNTPNDEKGAQRFRLNLLFGSPTGRPSRVRGPVPWNDLRWWAMRRYRLIRTMGEASFGPWTFVLPGLCAAGRSRDGSFEAIADGLRARLTIQDVATVGPPEATRWVSNGIRGTLWHEARAGQFSLGACLTGEAGTNSGPPIGCVVVEATSADRHELHWATALVHSIRPKPFDTAAT